MENWWISWKMSEIKSAELLREAERRRMVYRGSRRVKKRHVFLKLLNRVGKVLILKFGL